MGGAIQSTASGAGGGAAIGTALGGPGIGTGIGAGLGLLSNVLGSSQQQPLQTHTDAGPQAPQIAQLTAPASQRASSTPISFASGGVVPGQAPFPGQNTPANDIQPAYLTPGETVIPNSISHDPHLAALFASDQAHQIQNSFNNALGFSQGGIVPNPSPAPSPMMNMLQAVPLQQPFTTPSGQAIGLNADGSSNLSSIIQSMQPPAGSASTTVAPAPAKAGKVSSAVAKAPAAQAPAADTSGKDDIDEEALAEAPSDPDAPATTQAATDSSKFLGLSGGQWQGVGVASSILARLFERNPTILQTHMASGPQMPNVSTVSADRSPRRA